MEKIKKRQEEYQAKINRIQKVFEGPKLEEKSENKTLIDYKLKYGSNN